MGKASRRKRHQKKIASTIPREGPHGFDYGLSVGFAAIGSIEFNQALRDAEIVAIAYGLDYSTDLGTHVPILSLVGRNEKPLQAAFEEFARWAEFSDADSIEVTLVFLRSGGYALILSPEPRALIARTLKYDALFDPLAFQISWIKPIDTVSEALRQLRAHLETGIRPYILSAAVHSGIIALDRPLPELMRPIHTTRQLLKFRISFVDEGSDMDKHWQMMAVMASRTGEAKEAKNQLEKGGQVLPPESLLRARTNRLCAIFPVTMWRSQNSEMVRSSCNTAVTSGLRLWQVQQALCNTVMSREVGAGHPHFSGISEKSWPNALIERLRNRYEVADGKPGPEIEITSEELISQAVADSAVLLAHYGIEHPPESVDEIQRQLAKLKLLGDP